MGVCHVCVCVCVCVLCCAGQVPCCDLLLRCVQISAPAFAPPPLDSLTPSCLSQLTTKLITKTHCTLQSSCRDVNLPSVNGIQGVSGDWLSINIPLNAFSWSSQDWSGSTFRCESVIPAFMGVRGAFCWSLHHLHRLDAPAQGSSLE